MGSTKAQITIFIIIGMIIILVSLIMYIKSPDSVSEYEVVSEDDVSPISSYINECIKKVGKEAIILNSLQGGYYKLPEYSTSNQLFNTPFYYYDLKGYPLTIEKLEYELELYVDNELKNCINLTIFSDEGIIVKLGIVNTDVNVGSDNVEFLLDFPITITEQAKQTNINSFIAQIEDSSLIRMHNASLELTNNQLFYLYSLCLSCIHDIAVSNNVNIDTFDIDDNEVLFSITDENYLISDDSLEYRFSFKFNDYDCDNIPNSLPEGMKRSKEIECLEERLG